MRALDAVTRSDRCNSNQIMQDEWPFCVRQTSFDEPEKTSAAQLQNDKPLEALNLNRVGIESKSAKAKDKQAGHDGD